MSEKKEEITNQAEEVKKETFKTAKEVKDSVKNVNFKDETMKTKGFIGEMFKNPAEKIREIANEDTKYFKTALFILLIWTVAVFITSSYTTLYYFGITRVFSNILNVLKEILVPIVGVFVYSIIIFILNKNNKKSLTSIISTVTATRLPLAVASVVSILTLFSRDFTKINIAFNSLCGVITVILSYFGFKAIFNEKENSKFIKTFILIQVIYYLISIVLTFLEIYIY